ncbi:MAG: CBS domain-containing protein [Gammaproteobacteria bacterium]|nr:CBS domain-containing protein [Gammaproteobacteria bacterium]
MVTAASLLQQKKSPAIHVVEPEAPVLEAVRLMAEHAIGALLVMDGTRLAGIVSERDYARKVVLLGRSSSETPVWQIMSAPVHTVEPAATAQQCMQIMTDRRVRHLPVMQSGRVTGVLSIGDLVRAMLEEQQRTIEHLEHYIHG